MTHAQPTQLAQLFNPVVPIWGNETAAAKDGTLFTGYFLMMWNTVISIGAILVLAYFLWGAVEWITSGGDSSKLEGARNKMLHAFIGLLILVSAYTLIGFISAVVFGETFNILRPVFIVADQ